MRLFKVFYFGNIYVEDIPGLDPLVRNAVLFLSEFAATSYVERQKPERGDFYNYLTGDYQKSPWWIKEVESDREFVEIAINQGMYTYPNWPIYPPDSQLVYVDPEDTSMVNFWDGRRIVQMKPGRYLNRFHKNLNKVQVEYYARWWMDRNRPPRTITGAVKFAMTEEEMIDAYSRGPESCMLGKKAVRAYAAGDFAIAYLEMSSGEVGARVLVNTVTKTFGRIYPDDDEGSDLEALLRDLDYDSLEENENGFEGARFLQIPLPDHTAEDGDRISNRYDAWVMPYLDRGVFIDSRTWTATRNPEHMFRITSDSTAGYTGTLAKPCKVCGKPSLVQYNHQLVKHEDFGDETALCPEHRQSEQFVDALSGYIYFGQPTYIDSDGNPYSKSTIAAELYVSDHSGDWMLNFQSPSVTVDGKKIANSELDAYGARRSERYGIWTKRSEQELRDDHEPFYIRQKAAEAYWIARDKDTWFYDRDWELERGTRPPPDRNVEVQAARRVGNRGDIHREVHTLIGEPYIPYHIIRN